jgi:hypothetical protein
LASEANHVHIVVLDTLVRGKALVDQARPDAWNLVGHNACTHATTAHGHAAIHSTASYCARQGHYKIWIVIARFLLEVAKIGHFIASLTQHGGQIFPQLKSPVIGSDTYPFRRIGHWSSRLCQFALWQRFLTINSHSRADIGRGKNPGASAMVTANGAVRLATTGSLGCGNSIFRQSVWVPRVPLRER